MKQRSWKTTVSGFAPLLAILGAALNAQFDHDPHTIPPWDMVIVALGSALVGFFARDNDKSSESVGAAEKLAPAQSAKTGLHTRILPLVLLAGLAAGTSGCILDHRDKGDIVGITQSVVGIDISQSPADAVPHIRLGYVRSQIHVVPTGKGTNGVIHAPPVANSMHTEVTLGKTDITEDFNTGAAAEDDVWREGPTAARAVAAGKGKTNSVTNPK